MKYGHLILAKNQLRIKLILIIWIAYNDFPRPARITL
jgi:hypothetical protein